MSTAYDDLRRRMVIGEIAPGRPLGEVHLAAELGVSRPTVREALRRLESDGLAESDGRGLRVARMDEHQLRSAMLMRASLEALHAELAARRVAAGEVAPAHLRRLRELADDAERATDARDLTRAVQYNRSFHQAIDALADSQVSAVAVDRLWDRIVIATKSSLQLGGRGDVVNQEHRELLDALGAGDAERAADVANTHVRATINAANQHDRLSGPTSNVRGSV